MTYIPHRKSMDIVGIKKSVQIQTCRQIGEFNIDYVILRVCPPSFLNPHPQNYGNESWQLNLFHFSKLQILFLKEFCHIVAIGRRSRAFESDMAAIH